MLLNYIIIVGLICQAIDVKAFTDMWFCVLQHISNDIPPSTLHVLMCFIPVSVVMVIQSDRSGGGGF